MPILEEVKPKRKTPTKRKSVVKKTPTKMVQDPLPRLDEVAEDSVINEILELEHDMACTPDEKTTVTNSHVQIVSELEENSKLMEAIDKGVVAKPKNFKLPKLDFLQKAPKVTKTVKKNRVNA